MFSDSIPQNQRNLHSSQNLGISSFRDSSDSPFYYPMGNYLSKQTGFKCPHCPEIFENRIRLRYHKTEYHMDKMAFACRHCGKKFSTSHHVKQHEQGHRGPVKCPECERVFRHTPSLYRHLKLVHNRLTQATHSAFMQAM